MRGQGLVLLVFTLVFVILGCGSKVDFNVTPISEYSFTQRIDASSSSMLGNSLANWAYSGDSTNRAKHKEHLERVGNTLQISFDPPLSSISEPTNTRDVANSYVKQCSEQLKSKSELNAACFFVGYNASLLVQQAMDRAMKDEKAQVDSRILMDTKLKLAQIKEILGKLQMSANVTSQWSRIETKVSEVKTNRDMVLATFDVVLWQSDFTLGLMEMPEELRPGGRAFDQDTNQSVDTKRGQEAALVAGGNINYWQIKVAVHDPKRSDVERYLRSCASDLKVDLTPDPSTITDADTAQKAAQDWHEKFSASLIKTRSLFACFQTGFLITSFELNGRILASNKPTGPYSAKDLDKLISALAMVGVMAKDLPFYDAKIQSDLDKIKDHFSSAENGQEMTAVADEASSWYHGLIERTRQ